MAGVWTVVYCKPTNSVLMLQRAPHINQGNTWNFPGGGVDSDDIFMDAQREVQEECGQQAYALLEPLFSRTNVVEFKQEGGSNVITYYLISVPAQFPCKVNLFESRGWKWFELHELPTEEECHTATWAIIHNELPKYLEKFNMKPAEVTSSLPKLDNKDTHEVQVDEADHDDTWQARLQLKTNQSVKILQRYLRRRFCHNIAQGTPEHSIAESLANDMAISIVMYYREYLPQLGDTPNEIVQNLVPQLNTFAVQMQLPLRSLLRRNENDRT